MAVKQPLGLPLPEPKRALIVLWGRRCPARGKCPNNLVGGPLGVEIVYVVVHRTDRAAQVQINNRNGLAKYGVAKISVSDHLRLFPRLRNIRRWGQIQDSGRYLTGLVFPAT